MPNGVILSEQAFRDLQRQLRDLRAELRQLQPNQVRKGFVNNLMVLLDDDLYAADDMISDEDATTATGSVQGIDANGDMFDTGRNVTVTNRFENINIAAGTLCKVEWINGEWQPYAADCPVISSSSLNPGGPVESTEP